jgi:hypothetical protein
MTDTDAGRQAYDKRSERLLEHPGVTRSTMMGLPCLRVDGAFFASWDRTTGALLVKLPAAEVDSLIASGKAESFAPAGRRFKEWAAIPHARVRAWSSLLDRAYAYVSGSGSEG